MTVSFGSTVYVLGVQFSAGLGGWDPFGGGADGQPSLGPKTSVAGYPRSYTISGVGDGGGTATIAYGGVAGDLVLSLVGLSMSPLFLLEHAGTLVPPILPIIIVHGPASGSGALTTPVPLPPLPPGFETFHVFAQGAAISAVGAAVLAAPSSLVIL